MSDRMFTNTDGSKFIVGAHFMEDGNTWVGNVCDHGLEVEINVGEVKMLIGDKYQSHSIDMDREEVEAFVKFLQTQYLDRTSS